MNGTINPDFSQVEADAGQFTFDPRNALFFPEKRPFFLDGAELFNTPNNLIYTRRIVAPEAAVKLTGKAAGTDIAVLSAIDDRGTSLTARDHPVFNIVRLQHDLPRSSKVGFAYTDRIEGTSSNRVFAADTRLLFGSIYNLQLQGGGSRTVVDGRAITGADLAGDLQPRRPALRLSLSDDRHSRGFSSGERLHQPRRHHHHEPHPPRDMVWRRGRAAAKLDDERAAERRVAVPPHHRRRAMAREEAALQQHLQARRRLAGRRVGAVRVVRLRRAVLQGLRAPGGRRARRSCPSPARRTSRTTTTSSRSTRRSSRASRAASSTSGATTRTSSSGRRRNIVFATYAVDWRPSEKLRIDTQYQLQSYERRSDGSTVGVRRIPRLKVEYQVSRPIFLRVIGEYDARRAGHAARRFAHRAADPDSRSGDRTLCAVIGVRAQSLPRRRAVLLSADAGHRGVRRLQQPPDGTGRAAIR